MPDTTQQSMTALAPSQPTTIDKSQSAKQTRLAAFTPSNLTEAIALAKMMAQSNMVPKEYKGKPADILVAIQFGSEVGLAPMQSLQSIAVINGKPCLYGDGALALVQGHPEFEDIIETTDGTVATCIVKRKGRTPCKRTFSDDDALKAGLIQKGGVWNQYRARMRQCRARGFALRDAFADVLKGISIAEEAMDLPIDQSPAKQQREAMTFDVTSLSPSPEPNRGHLDTGLQRQSEQPSPKEPPAICGSCGKTGGHEEGCKYAEQDKKTSKPTQKCKFMIFDVIHKKKKDGTPYLMLQVIDEMNNSGKMYVWHRSWDEQLIAAKGQGLLCEYSVDMQGDKKFVVLEHILELAGVPYVNDAPAISAEMPVQEEPF
jgi:hypothetical protein